MARFGHLGQQYSDNNGNPLAGGLIYFYDSGTTTPKTTYSDEAQTVANANPVVLDAYGRCGPIFFSGEARAILKDSANVQIEDMDPVGEPAFAVSTLTANLDFNGYDATNFSASGESDITITHAFEDADSNGLTLTVDDTSGSFLTSGSYYRRGIHVSADLNDDDTASGVDIIDYGIAVDMTHSGAPDFVRGAYAGVTLDHTSGNVTSSAAGIRSEMILNAGDCDSSYGGFFSNRLNASGYAIDYVYGTYSDVEVNATPTSFNEAIAHYAKVNISSTLSSGYVAGVFSEVEINSGTTPLAYGIANQFDLDGGTITEAYHIYCDIGSTSGSIGTLWGFKLEGCEKSETDGSLRADALYSGHTALSGTTPTIDCSTLNVASHTLSGNTTYAFSGVPVTGTAFTLDLFITQGGSAYTITWPAAVQWPGGSAPAVPGTGETDSYTLTTFDGGVTWYGRLVGDNFS